MSAERNANAVAAMQKLHAEAGGAITLQVVEVSAALDILAVALRGHPGAIEMFALLDAACERMRVAASAGEPMCCGACQAPFTGPDIVYAVVMIRAARPDASAQNCLAICTGCASTRAQALKRAQDGLRAMAWPDLRSIEVSDQAGHA